MTVLALAMSTTHASPAAQSSPRSVFGLVLVLGGLATAALSLAIDTKPRA